LLLVNTFFAYYAIFFTNNRKVLHLCKFRDIVQNYKEVYEVSTVGQRIRAKREEAGLSVESLAQLLGKDRATVYRYESDFIENFPVSIIEPLAIALNTSPSHLMGWSETSAELPNAAFDNILPIEKRKIPLLGEIAAGEPIYADEHFERYVEVGADLKVDFALRVKGDSMVNIRINDGDIVFIRKQPIVDNGEIAAVLIDDEATLKRFKRYGDTVVLQAENPNYKDIVIDLSDGNDVRILGKAVAFQSNVR
jgi:repressor LexA